MSTDTEPTVLEPKLLEEQRALHPDAVMDTRLVRLEEFLAYGVQVTELNELLDKSLSPQVLSALRRKLVKPEAPTVCVALSGVGWQMIIADPVWHQIFDPVLKYAKLLTGYLGVSLGMDFLTDTYSHPAEHFLKKGDLVMFSMSPGGEVVEAIKLNVV